MSVQSLPLWKKWMYALGQFGWALASYAVGNSLVYFYLPPKGDMGPFVPQGNVLPLITADGVVLFGLTIIGLVFSIGRLFDAVTDPLIAGLSDRSRFKFGKRRSFLAIAVLPFALFSVLAFMPPNPGISILNVVWLSVMVLLFYWFMTMYVTPFFALLSELGHTPDERLQLSTMISITWALGTMVGSQIEAFQGMVGTAFPALGPAGSFQVIVVLFALVSIVFMALPIIFIDESRFSSGGSNQEPIMASLKSAFSNRDFLVFTLSDLAYWVAITIINSVMVYYVVVLLGLEPGTKGLLVAIMFLLSFVFYLPVNLVARKAGKKNMLALAFLLMTLVFVYTIFLGQYPFPPFVQGLVLAILAAFPLSIFSIVQNAVVSDIAEADGRETGNFKAGIFFGARTFMSKLGQTLAGFIIPSLLILGAGRAVGSSQTGDLAAEAAGMLGVRLTAVVAAVFCLAGGIIFLGYREKRILAVLESGGEAGAVKSASGEGGD